MNRNHAASLVGLWLAGAMGIAAAETIICLNSARDPFSGSTGPGYDEDKVLLATSI
jgi:hypothetical protein